MSAADQSPLGKASIYPNHYDPGLLFSIDRAPKRAELGIAGVPPFHGVDLWTAYELSWLDLRGMPRVAMAEFQVPAHSPRLVESKSLKLYLNGFAGERLQTDTLLERLCRDLTQATGSGVGVQLVTAQDFSRQQLTPLVGSVIDDLELDIDCYGPPNPNYLNNAPGSATSETLVSHLLKSNCPVTGQPDWGSVQVRYSGKPIDRAGLLRYLISFREHQGFHEQCVERIWLDIMQRCQPLTLSVYARYTRRGGIDINPLRSSQEKSLPLTARTARQ